MIIFKESKHSYLNKYRKGTPKNKIIQIELFIILRINDYTFFKKICADHQPFSLKHSSPFFNRMMYRRAKLTFQNNFKNVLTATP